MDFSYFYVPCGFLKLLFCHRTLVPPQIAAFSFGDEPSNPGESAGVQCMITKGDLPMTIKWILNSALLVSGENGVSIVKLSPKTSVLNIPSVNEMHRGIYKCIAENSAGENSHTAEFVVNGTFFI